MLVRKKSHRSVSCKSTSPATTTRQSRRRRSHASNGSHPNPIMHLYILTSTVNVDVSEVTLENGCLPVISGHQGLVEDATKGVNIEPAIWFKVLVIDAISIDCTQRRISWSSVSGVAVNFKGNDSGIDAGGSYCSTDDGQPSTGEAGRHLTRSITEAAFDCGECYSYDRDLDEVFDSVPALVAEYQENVITRDKFHERLMHLLHISVLPIIKLGCEDIANVSDCLKRQDVYLQEVDRKILALTENLEKRRKDKKEQRRKFIDEILRSSPKNPTYPKDIVQILAHDITTDVTEAYEAFDKAQRDVDQTKKLAANACDPNVLETQRKLRDRLHGSYENLLSVRERLREMKDSKASITRKLTKPFRNALESHHENPVCAVYLIMTKQENDKVVEIRNLTDKKLLMLSVKEAMRTTLDELMTGGETFGVDADSTGSLKATNVMNSLAPTSTSWQTLAEQVARVLSNREHLLAKAHVKFCAEVNSRCQRAVEELTIYRRTSSQSTLCIRSSGNSGSSDKSTTSDSSSLENSFTKDPCPVAESPGGPGSDWTVVDRSMLALRTSRDSAVSETSCASARTSNASYEPRLLNDAAGSRSSECSVISEVSTTDEHGGQRAKRGRKAKKEKAKKPVNSNVATFHSYLGDEQCGGVNSPVYFEKSPDELSVMILKDDRSFLRREIDGLLQLIAEHFNDICGRLQTELKLTQARYFRKIWLYYESHFYQETMDSLVQLYQLDYTNVTDALCDSLRTLTVSDLSLDDAILSHMLQDVNGGRQASPSSEGSGPGARVSAEQAGCAGEGQYHSLLRNKGDSSSSGVSQSNTSPKDPTHRYCSFVAEDTNHVTETPVYDRTDATSDPSVRVLRRRLSELPSRPKTVRLSLSVQYPKSGVIVYERLLCPVRNSVLVEGVASGASPTETSPSGLPSPVDSTRSASSSSDLPEEDQGLCKVKTTTMKPKYRRQFAAALRCIDVVVSTRCPSAKFQHLTRCLREVSHQITNFYQELYGRQMGACSDELMDALVILLCNLDGVVLSQLYCQIMILADIIPPFFNGSPFSFTLVQFVGACQFVQERILIKKNRISS